MASRRRTLLKITFNIFNTLSALINLTILVVGLVFVIRTIPALIPVAHIIAYISSGLSLMLLLISLFGLCINLSENAVGMVTFSIMLAVSTVAQFVLGWIIWAGVLKQYVPSYADMGIMDGSSFGFSTLLISSSTIQFVLIILAIWSAVKFRASRPKKHTLEDSLYQPPRNSRTDIQSTGVHNVPYYYNPTQENTLGHKRSVSENTSSDASTLHDDHNAAKKFDDISLESSESEPSLSEEDLKMEPLSIRNRKFNNVRQFKSEAYLHKNVSLSSVHSRSSNDLSREVVREEVQPAKNYPVSKGPQITTTGAVLPDYS